MLPISLLIYFNEKIYITVYWAVHDIDVNNIERFNF